MKRFITSIFVALIAITTISPIVAITPLRAAKCYFYPGKYQCADHEIKEAKQWLIVSSIGAVAATAALIGLDRAVVYKAQQDAKAKVRQAREEEQNAIENIRKRRAGQ